MSHKQVTPQHQMCFSHDPTSRGDEMAAYLREWYEANRESWWERRGEHWRYAADNFMIGLHHRASEIDVACAAQDDWLRRHPGKSQRDYLTSGEVASSIRHVERASNRVDAPSALLRVGDGPSMLERSIDRLVRNNR